MNLSVKETARRIATGTPYHLNDVAPERRRFILARIGIVRGEFLSYTEAAAASKPGDTILSPADQIELANQCFRNRTSDERWP